MSTRLADQPAILEWLPLEMKAVGHHQPIQITRQRRNFETVEAAVAYATSALPEAFRANATITTGDITLRWDDIERWNRPV
jgi:hypothetical protein